tara:strand:- start:83 stop:463 length:381 start_codon:yes stop_codon:yes gene_type:complete
MIADLIIKIVCKLFDRAMKEHDQEQIRLHEHRIMLTNRAKLTSSDELVISWIERNAPLSFEDLGKRFDTVNCLAKRVSVLMAYGFINMEKGIISLSDKYKPIAAEISTSSTDQTIVFHKDDTIRPK